MVLDALKRKRVSNYDKSPLHCVFVSFYVYQLSWALKRIEVEWSVWEGSSSSVPTCWGRQDRSNPRGVLLSTQEVSAFWGNEAQSLFVENIHQTWKQSFTHWWKQFLQLLGLQCITSEIVLITSKGKSRRYGWWIRNNFSIWFNISVMSWNNAQELCKEWHLTAAK